MLCPISINSCIKSIVFEKIPIWNIETLKNQDRIASPVGRLTKLNSPNVGILLCEQGLSSTRVCFLRNSPSRCLNVCVWWTFDEQYINKKSDDTTFDHTVAVVWRRTHIFSPLCLSLSPHLIPKRSHILFVSIKCDAIATSHTTTQRSKLYAVLPCYVCICAFVVVFVFECECARLRFGLKLWHNITHHRHSSIDLARAKMCIL